jgi:NADH dehydrogenase FAD-containing subunit
VPINNTRAPGSSPALSCPDSRSSRSYNKHHGRRVCSSSDPNFQSLSSPFKEQIHLSIICLIITLDTWIFDVATIIAMVKTIVVLGAGPAALPVVRQTMRTLVLPNSDYKMVVAAPNTHMLWPVAMPRVVVPGQMALDKAMGSIDVDFKEYPADKFEHLIGNASRLDPTSKTATVSLSNGGERSVTYDYLVVATGSSARDNMPWKVVETTEKTKASLGKLHSDIEKASKIVVVGGGITGVETAGELGSKYSKSGSKEVYLVYSGELPFSSDIIDSTRKTAKSQLENLKVKLIPNSTVTKATAQGGNTVLEITGKDGQVTNLTTGAYIPAKGMTPNSSFAPASMLDNQGYIKQTKTLQAEGHPDIFVVGDVGSLEINRLMMAEAQATHLFKALPEHIQRGTAIPEYKPDTKNAFLITVGPSKGTGQMGTWKLPSIMVWMFKCRTMMTEVVEGWARGKRGSMATYEK